MRQELKEYRQEQKDDAVFALVGEDRSSGVSLNDMVKFGIPRGTAEAAVKRLMANGKVDSVYDGNERFGRFLYFRKSCA